MKEFKVGDKVFDLRFGNGEVVNVGRCVNYAITVNFDNNNKDQFTNDGFANISHKWPILYHGHDLEVIVKKPTYEYQFLFKDREEDAFKISSFYNSLDDFKSEASNWGIVEIVESSKRIAK